MSTAQNSNTESCASPWQQQLHTTLTELRSEKQVLQPSHTRVFDAVAFLLRSGVLNVKGTSYLNVKQGRALLHWAWWLQQEKSRAWVEAGTLEPPPFVYDDAVLQHVLIGGAGSGKTTTMLVVEALLELFLGPGTFKKSAPTNTAARLWGGDTSHAVYKLPRGSLLGRRARLSSRVLRAMRKQWQSIRAQAIDEISMMPPQLLFQIDMRTRQAKAREHHTFGKLATGVCGDFLQMPPVEEPSLALPLDDAGYLAQLDEQVEIGADGHAQEKKERRDRTALGNA